MVCAHSYFQVPLFHVHCVKLKSVFANPTYLDKTFECAPLFLPDCPDIHNFGVIT